MKYQLLLLIFVITLIIRYRYKEAEVRFLEALDRIKQIKQPIISEKWESLFNNLGHVYRKLQKYDKALEYHKQVIYYQHLRLL